MSEKKQPSDKMKRQMAANQRWRAKNREHYNAYMRAYRKRKKEEKQDG